MRYTPVTEMTSFKTAGRDIPLTSPSDGLSALLSPVGMVLDVPPVVLLVVRCSRSQRSAELTGGRDRCDPLLEELVVLVLECDHDLREVLVGIDFARERLGRTKGERGRDDAVDLPGRSGSFTNGC